MYKKSDRNWLIPWYFLVNFAELENPCQTDIPVVILKQTIKNMENLQFEQEEGKIQLFSHSTK